MKPPDRLDELLADRAVVGLDEVEERELQSLLADHGHVDPDTYERAAAALHVSMLEVEPVQLPPELRAKLLKQAEAFRSGCESRSRRGGAGAPIVATGTRLRAVPPFAGSAAARAEAPDFWAV